VPVSCSLALAPLLALTLTVPAGCGSDGSTKPEQLSADEEAQVSQAENAIHSYCRELLLYLTHRKGAPTSADSDRALGAADRLVELARRKPDALYRQQNPLRLELGDLAEDLEGTNCSPAIGRKLDRALATLPP
jgi:hypothetical protein